MSAGDDVEASWSTDLVKLAKQHGWMVQRIQKTRRNGRVITAGAKGFPDLMLVKPPMVLFLELKTLTGKPRPEQVEWITALQACNTVEAYFVNPSEERSIVELLTGLT